MTKEKKKRKLFCQISPLTYEISKKRCCVNRDISDFFSRSRFAKTKSEEPLPVSVIKHKSLIRRKLGNVRMDLQENKAVNLSIAAPKVNGILIKPGETFSFWRLVGDATAEKGYLNGVVISSGKVLEGIGGGMCQFTNLIHWMILHTPMKITEHHHHDSMDLFPDFNRQIPFGTGTSIMYNYLDYRFCNTTDNTYQLLCYTTDTYLCGELRAVKPQDYVYHIFTEGERFEEEDGVVYRLGRVYRKTVDRVTGNTVEQTLVRDNRAKVMYDLKYTTLNK
ncbi:MAG: VanW family protein [Oscillospiraceae bacterium]|nr:VanW family protein [Oscillospiraceae bacterium]